MNDIRQGFEAASPFVLVALLILLWIVRAA